MKLFALIALLCVTSCTTTFMCHCDKESKEKEKVSPEIDPLKEFSIPMGGLL
jgi:hypothetical protein